MAQPEGQSAKYVIEVIGGEGVTGERQGILSPLRLPVPPSRLFLEVVDSKAYFTFSVLFIQDNDCETV